MTTTAIREVLRECGLFAELSEEERDRIARLAVDVSFEPGDILFSEGEKPEWLYVVMQGTIAVEVGLVGRKRRRQATLTLVRRGGIVGWSAGLGSEKYLASAIAREKSAVLAIGGEAIRRLLDGEPLIALQVTRKLADVARSRLVRTTEILANVLSVSSHDMKAPLAAVQSFHQVILAGYAGAVTEQQKSMLLRSGERIKGLISIIDDMSELPRLGPEEMAPEETSITEIAERAMAKTSARAAEKGVDIVREWAEHVPHACVDPARLQQVVEKLLENAVKFTPSGGKVVLRISNDSDGRITGERKQVIQRVKSAIEFYKAAGREIALAEFSSARGRFSRDQRYVFALGLDGTMLAHGLNEKCVGKNFVELKDTDGRQPAKEIIDMARGVNSGWVAYRWHHPQTGEERPKVAYFDRIDDVVICSGMYPDLVVEVMDTGEGISAEDLPGIFDDFYRGRDAPAGGVGVGLSIAKRIIEAHGGRIWVESPYSESERGAKFIFTLPRR